jgi:predicted amidohydrolase
VIARHDKFQLYGTENKHGYTPGSSVVNSVFDTAAGKVALLAGMDVGCIIKKNIVGISCTQHGVDMLKDLSAQKPDIVLFAAAWEAAGTNNPVWKIVNIGEQIATDFGVWTVLANTTKSPGQGGGIWKPGGTPVDTVQGTTPTIVYGEIPLKTSPPQDAGVPDMSTPDLGPDLSGTD